MISKLKAIAVSLFILLLVMPSLIWFGFMDEDQRVNLENRTHLDFPDLEEVGWSSMFGSIEDWFVDNAPFKTFAVGMKNSLSTAFFGEIESNNVIYGDEGWLFYKGIDDGETLLEYKGLLSLSDAEMEAYKQDYIAAQNNLNAQGIQLYQIVLPNKEIAYAEYMPDSIKRVDTKSQAQYLEEYLQSEGISSFDYLLEEMQDEDMPLYYKYDTHWNFVGSYRGYLQLLSMIESEASASDVSFKNNGRLYGDLTNMTGLTLKEPYCFTNEEKFSFKSNTLISKPTYVKYFQSTLDDPDDRKILLIGDSFREQFEYFIAQDFSETISASREALDLEGFTQINFKPNIVVLVSPERYLMQNQPVLDWLAHKQF